MILPRRLFDAAAPERHGRAASNPTLLYSWWCTCFSALIIAVRLFGRFVRNQQFFREDKIMACSIVPLFARMALVHLVLVYGTNNVDLAGLTDPLQIHHRRIGSQMVLGARIFFAMFIWMAKFTVAEFLGRLTDRFWKRRYDRGLRCIRVFLLVTFIMVMTATLAECRPTSHYWQVVPDPGPQCRQGYAQLLTMGTTDIITDIVLVAFPIPIIIWSSMALLRKLSLVGLFSMSIALIAVTGARMPLVVERRGLQPFRTMFASSEILTATFVSNIIILGSFLRDRGVKKQKFKASSTENSLERGGSITRLPPPHCYSSEENLARSLGFRTQADWIDPSPTLPRPACVTGFPRRPSASQANTPTFPDDELAVQWGSSSSSGGGGSRPTMAESDRWNSASSPRQEKRVWFHADESPFVSTVLSLSTDSVVAHDFAHGPGKTAQASIA